MSNIYTDKFKSIIRSLPSLSEEDEKYVYEVFQKRLYNGLSENEVKDQIRWLRNKTNDPLSSDDVDRIEKALLEEIQDK